MLHSEMFCLQVKQSTAVVVITREITAALGVLFKEVFWIMNAARLDCRYLMQWMKHLFCLLSSLCNVLIHCVVPCSLEEKHWSSTSWLNCWLIINRSYSQSMLIRVLFTHLKLVAILTQFKRKLLSRSNKPPLSTFDPLISQENL